MKSHKIRDLDTPELQVQLRDIDEQLFRLKLQTSKGQKERPNQVRAMLKYKAVIYTVLRERELATAAAGEKR